MERGASPLARVAWAVCGLGWTSHFLARALALRELADQGHDEPFSSVRSEFAYAAAASTLLATLFVALGRGVGAVLGAVGLCVLALGRLWGVAASADALQDGARLAVLALLTPTCIVIAIAGRRLKPDEPPCQ